MQINPSKEGGKLSSQALGVSPAADTLHTPHLPHSTFNEKRKLHPATNPTKLTIPQEPGGNQTPRMEQSQLGQEFPNEHTEQSSQEVAPLTGVGGEFVGNPPPQQRRTSFGASEASLPRAVVESSISDVVQQLQQVNTLENTDNLRYKELLQAFDEKTQRWQSVISIPELLIAQDLEGNSIVKSYAIWQFDRKYPSATTRIFDNATRRKLEDDEVRVKAQMIDMFDEYTFSVEVRGRRNQAFIDPYNNEHLNSMEILVNKRYGLSLDHPEIANPFAYNVIVIGRYQPYPSDILSMEGRKNRAIGLIVDNLSGELDIRTELGREALSYAHTILDDHNITEALSVDHAEALLQFMDKIIPPGSPSLTRNTDTKSTPARAKITTPRTIKQKGQ